MSVALYAGSFDPVTLGHLDIMCRVNKMFSRLYIGIGKNPEKEGWLPIRVREQFIRDNLLPSVTVCSYQGLTVDFAKEVGATILVRGVRDYGDLRKEMHIARVNKRISGIETVFLPPSDEHLILSSTFVRQVWEFGGKDPLRLENLVPDNVIEYLGLSGGTGCGIDPEGQIKVSSA